MATTSWHRYLDNKFDVAAMFFDLSKAFDSVPHSLLLQALANIGVCGSLLKWFESNLTGKKKTVCCTRWRILRPNLCYIWCPTRIHPGATVISGLHWSSLLSQAIHLYHYPALCRWHSVIQAPPIRCQHLFSPNWHRPDIPKDQANGTSSTPPKPTF